MKKPLLFALSYVGVVLFTLLIIYFIPLPREIAIRTLVAREMPGSFLPTALRTVTFANSAATPSAATLTTSSSSIDHQPFTASSSSVDYQPVTTYEYKLVQGADPCTLAQLGAAGWNAQQFGGNLVQVPGKDADCKGNYGNYLGFDWVFFVRTHVPVTSCSSSGG